MPFPRRLWFALSAMLTIFIAAPKLAAQGGEPQYFAIRGATVVPVLPTRPRQDSVLEGRNFRKNSLAGRARGLSIAPHATTYS